MSVLTDVNILQGGLNATLFPGLNDTAQVHTGFRDEHEKTAGAILAEVKRLMVLHNTTAVTTVCLCTLKAMHLHLS
jgi:hypothetical protein